MTEIRISIVNVADNEGNYLFWIDELEESFKSTSYVWITNVKIYRFMDVQNIDQLEKEIISTIDLNTTDIILIFGLSSMKNDITRRIIKVREDTEDAIGRLFAKIPTLLYPINDVNMRSTCQNDTLIFIVTGEESNIIIDYIEATALSIAISAHLLQLTIKYHNFNHREVAEDKVLSTQHSDSSSTIESSDFYDSSDKNISANNTCQYNVSVTDALSLISKTKIKLESVLVSVSKARRRILSRSITGSMKMATFSVATKQEHAVRAQKETNEAEVKTNESNKINPVKLDPDTKSHVDKEEHIPLETTDVIPAENVINSYSETGLLIKSASHSLQYVNFPDSDIERNKLIIKKFTCLGSKEVALLTACGYTHVKVLRKLYIGITTIGNMLQEPEQSLESENSHDYNRVILLSLLKENNFICKVSDLGFQDLFSCSLKDTIEKIRKDLETIDLLVIMGNKKSLDIILKDLNATLHFENVDMKLGKSITFASCNIEGNLKVILYLPGNPASVFMTAHVLLLPLVKEIYKNCKKNTISAKLEQELLLHSRPRHVWATLSWDKEECLAKVTCKKDNPISSNLSDIIGANVLLKLPSKTRENSTLETPTLIPATLVPSIF